MRFIRRFSPIIAVAATLALPVLAIPATAQMTNFNATSVEAGDTPTTGQICLTAVDRYSNPIAITKSGGGYYIKGRPFCGALNNGSLVTSIQVPDSNTDSAPGHGYSMVIFDSVNKFSSEPQTIFGITGGTWSLDTYAPAAAVTTTISYTFTLQPGPPSGSCNAPAQYQDDTANVLYLCGSDHAWHQTVGPIAGVGVQLGQDIGGTNSAPKVVGLQGQPVASTVPTSGQALIFTNGAWTPENVSQGAVEVPLTCSGSLTITLAPGDHIYDVTLTSNCTLTFATSTPNGIAQRGTVIIRPGGFVATAPTSSSALAWAGGSAPLLSSSQVSLFSLTFSGVAPIFGSY